EEHQEGVSLQILIGDYLPILIDELEGSADRGDLLRHRRGEAPGQDEDNAEAKRQTREKGGGHQKDAAVACGHFGMPSADGSITSRRRSRQRSSRRIPPCRSGPTAPASRPAGSRRPRRAARTGAKAATALQKRSQASMFLHPAGHGRAAALPNRTACGPRQ